MDNQNNPKQNTDVSIKGWIPFGYLKIKCSVFFFFYSLIYNVFYDIFKSSFQLSLYHNNRKGERDSPGYGKYSFGFISAMIRIDCVVNLSSEMRHLLPVPKTTRPSHILIGKACGVHEHNIVDGRDTREDESIYNS